MEVVVELAETKITTGDLIGLRVGDIITTEKDVNTPIVISVEGLPKFHARAGAFKGRKAIRIDEAMASVGPPAAIAAKPAAESAKPQAAPAAPAKKK